MDVISFFSPSAIENMRAELGEEMLSRLGAKAALAAVGPVTAAALRNAGLPVAIEAPLATAESMAAAIEKYFSPSTRLKSEGGMSFPVTRPRRLRRSEAIRSLARETRLSTHGFIYPMFVCPGKNVRNPIGSMPGVAQQSVDTFLEECREVEQLGIPGIILFGIPDKKTRSARRPMRQMAWCSAPSRRYGKRI